VVAYNTFADPDAQEAIEVRGIPTEGVWVTRNRHRPQLFVQSKVSLFDYVLPNECPGLASCHSYIYLNQSY
jgi:hypothetical protein